MRVVPAITLLVCLAFAACGKLEGEFAFKRPRDDLYKKITRPLEFPADEEVRWVFRFKAVRSRKHVGVILMKKETFWVDVKTTSEVLEKGSQFLYGVISNLKQGDYEIVVTDVRENNRVVARCPFVIYDRDEERED